jgi:YD repeat-containing protein
MLRKITLIISPLLYFSICYSQVDLSKIIPPAPDAAVLAKFVDIPVGHYTGTPIVNIPIYEIADGDLRLSVNLGYHAGGVKVEEIASCVGLNWTLNAGGVITRSIVGLPDDTKQSGRNGFLNYSENIQYSINDIDIQSGQEKLNVFSQYVEGCIDTEPDVFFFNFNGFSGKFSFSWNGANAIVLSSDKKLSILPTFDSNDPYSSIVKWTVLSDDGTKYIFESRENTTHDNVSEHGLSCSTIPLTYTSSWYLTKVISNNSTNEINITYSDYTIEHGFSESETFSHKLTNSAESNCPGSFSPTISISTNTLVTHGKRVQTIYSSVGTQISFEPASQPRADVTGINAFSINRIKVWYKSDVIKDCQLNYDYSNGSRLMLRSITESGESKPPYIFEYNKVQLPSRNSKAQDYWGYHNANAASHLVPSLAVLFSGSGQYHYFSGANREPDPTKMKAGILEKIIYPTKGSVSFEYEPHDYSYVQMDSLEMLSIPILKDTSVLVVKTGNNLNNWNSQVIEILYKTVVNLQAEFSPAPLLGDLSWMYPKVKITDSNGIIQYQRTYQEGSHNTSLLLAPGLYTVSAYAFATSGSVSDEASVRITWKKPSKAIVLQKKLQAGGLRVKSVKYHDGISSANDIIENYEYAMGHDAMKSSGVLMGEIDRSTDDQSSHYDLVGRLPMFVHEFVTIRQNSAAPQDPLETCYYLNRFSVNRASLGSTSGSHIGYRQVMVYRNEGVKTGKTRFIYTSPYEYGEGIINELPFPPSQGMDFKRGLLKNKISYAYNPIDGYKILQEERFNYTYYTESVLQLKVAKYMTASTAQYTDFKVSIYSAYFGYATQTTKETFDYVNNGINAMHTSTAFEYDVTDKQLKRRRTTGSDGKVVETLYSYPLDFAQSGNQIINLLIEKHMFSTMLKQEDFKQQQLVSGKVIEYALKNNLLLPSKELSYEVPFDGLHNSQTSFSNKNYKNRILYDLYDQKGNIIQYSLDDGISTSFIWGYDSHLPIAKVVNANYESCFYTSFEEIGTIGNSVSGKRYYSGTSYTIPLTHRPIGDNLVMTFWYKTGNEWNFHSESPYSHEISVSNANAYDELRVYPKRAQMTTYTYDPEVGLTSITDSNNIVTNYSYDNLRRLRKVQDADGQILKTIEYFFKE